MTDFSAFSQSPLAFEMVRGNCLLNIQQTPDASIDAFVTDPPYGIELKIGTRSPGKRSIIGDGKTEARRLWKRFVPQAWRTARPDTAHLFFGSWKSPWMHDLLAEHFTVKGCIVWDKRIIGLGWYLRPQWELIFYCHKGKPPLPDRAEPDIWPQARKIGTRHPCEKPVDLMRRAVRMVAPPGSIICDPFAGIASTGVAALLEGRRFFGIEIDRRFHRMGMARLIEAEQGRQNIGRTP